MHSLAFSARSPKVLIKIQENPQYDRPNDRLNNNRASPSLIVARLSAIIIDITASPFTMLINVRL